MVNRPGSGDVDLSILKQFVSSERFQEFEKLKITCPRIEISSSEIRRKVGAGESIRFLTPRSVDKYIETQKLFVGQ